MHRLFNSFWFLYRFYEPKSVNCFEALFIKLLFNMFKVMLISCPNLDDLYHKSCSLSQDLESIQENFVHPTRLINFLVGVKGKNEPIAIGGPWSPSLDGADPVEDPRVLIKTAIRTTKALTGINLSSCTQW